MDHRASFEQMCDWSVISNEMKPQIPKTNLIEKIRIISFARVPVRTKDRCDVLPCVETEKE